MQPLEPACAVLSCMCNHCAFDRVLHMQHLLRSSVAHATFFLLVQCSDPKRLRVQLGLGCTCSSAMFRSKTIARAVGIGLHMQELCSVCTSKLHELLLHVQNLACCSFSLFLPLPEWNSLEKNLYVPKKCLTEKGEEFFHKCQDLSWQRNNQIIKLTGASWSTVFRILLALKKMNSKQQKLVVKLKQHLRWIRSHHWQLRI